LFEPAIHFVWELFKDEYATASISIIKARASKAFTLTRRSNRGPASLLREHKMLLFGWDFSISSWIEAVLSFFLQWGNTGVWTWALHLLGKCSTTWAKSSDQCLPFVGVWLQRYIELASNSSWLFNSWIYLWARQTYTMCRHTENHKAPSKAFFITSTSCIALEGNRWRLSLWEQN
jgi:hypothetical protein